MGDQSPTRTVFEHGWNEHFPGDQLSPDEITKGQGNNIFHVAAKYHESTTENLDPFLPAYPSKAYEQNARGDTPLHIAARLGKLDFATLLVQHARGIDVEGGYRYLLRKKNKKKNTALHEAVENGHYGVAKLLIEEDPNLSCFENNTGESPLFMAVDGGYHQIAHTILETFPNCSVLGRNGMTAMHAAVIRAQSCKLNSPQLNFSTNNLLELHIRLS